MEVINKVKAQELSKEAGRLLIMINKGIVNLPQLKNFLASIECLSTSHSPRHKNKQERLAHLESIIK